VDGDREFNNSKVWSEVATSLGNSIDQKGPNFVSQLV
jgi:hypothetical protein